MQKKAGQFHFGSVFRADLSLEGVSVEGRIGCRRWGGINLKNRNIGRALIADDPQEKGESANSLRSLRASCLIASGIVWSGVSGYTNNNYCSISSFLNKPVLQLNRIKKQFTHYDKNDTKMIQKMIQKRGGEVGKEFALRVGSVTE